VSISGHGICETATSKTVNGSDRKRPKKVRVIK
jgi:hypothetical protein